MKIYLLVCHGGGHGEALYSEELLLEKFEFLNEVMLQERKKKELKVERAQNANPHPNFQDRGVSLNLDGRVRDRDLRRRSFLRPKKK